MSVTDSVVRSPHQDSLLVPAADDQEAKGREEIAHLVAAISDYQALFERMMEVVRGFVPFDWAYLFIFTQGREYSRFVCEFGPKVPFQSRWFPTPKDYRDWIIQRETWIDDLETWIRRNAPELLKRADVKTSIAAGFKALVALPVYGGGRVVGGLCLYSKEEAKYGENDRRTLERLMVGQALLPVFHAADREERLFASDLVTKIAASRNSEELAQTVVEEIARFYGFKNVSIFKVNALSGRLRLLAQALAAQGGTSIPKDYSQPLKRGLLGEAYRRKDYVILKDVADGSREAQIYVPTAHETRSELCIPIKLSGRILWILNLEDTRTEAFTLGEVETLNGIIEQIQANLDRLFQRLVLVQVLDVIPEAVVITRQNGQILYCTKDALDMLGQSSTPTRSKLSKFLREAQFSELSVSPTKAEIVGAHNKRTPVLAQKFTLPEEYDYVVVVLQDVTQVLWKRDFEFFKAALTEAAAQVRVPVSLLSSFVQRIGQRTEDEKLQDLTRKARRQLDRIELTYDRVLASYDAQTLPAARKVPVDVNLALDHIISELPDLERECVRWSGDRVRAVVSADPYRVRFALGSMLAYLLRSRADAEPIEIAVHGTNEKMEVSMTGAVQRIEEPLGKLAALVESTRARIALGEGVLTRIAGECGGTFTRRTPVNGREKLSLRFAVTH